MVQKIKSEFRKKYPKLTLSDVRLDVLVTKWSKDATEETNIEELLNSKVDEEVLQIIVSQDDALRKPNKPETEKTEEVESVPAWAKAIQDELNEMKSGNAQKTREEDFNQTFKEAPDAIKAMLSVSNYKSMDEDSYNAFKTTAMEQVEVLKQKEAVTVPVFSQGKGANGKMTDDEIKEMVGQI